MALGMALHAHAAVADEQRRFDFLDIRTGESFETVMRRLDAAYDSGRLVVHSTYNRPTEDCRWQDLRNNTSTRSCFMRRIEADGTPFADLDLNIEEGGFASLGATILRADVHRVIGQFTSRYGEPKLVEGVSKDGSAYRRHLWIFSDGTLGVYQFGSGDSDVVQFKARVKTP